MRIIPLVITLLVASPVFGQVRVYTNSDLGKPLSRTSTLTPAEAAAILAPRQFVYVPEWPLAPLVVVARSSPTSGPFGEFKEFSPARRLDGSLWTDPPWSMTTYVGRQRYSLRDTGSRMGGHLLPPNGQPGSMTTRTIRSPQPGGRAAPATASGASWSGRRRPPRDER